MSAGLLHSKTALITGAANGIGEAAAELFAAEGATVALLDRDGDAAAAVAARIVSNGGRALAVPGDVTDEEGVARALRRVTDAVGELDAAFNNAGVPGEPGGLLAVGEAAWNRTLEVNLMGTWRCMRHEVAAMAAGGAIVNTTSLAGLIGAAHAAAYSASKHAIIGLTRSAALEFGTQGIRVNAIAPGPTRTAMLERVFASGARSEGDLTSRTALRRMAEPREIAEAALWLLSPRASYVTGHVLVVDGGQLAS